jgi:UDP-N-acetylmuramate--alanine ligase
VHLIGIGGTGISAIARVLLLRGCQVSGSDMQSNAETRSLQALGAQVYQGHRAENIGNAELLIVSSAVRADHVEIVAARTAGIPVYKRSDVLAAIMAGKHGIAVAGTHGKTTTTSMITHILIHAGHDPDYIVGGVMANTGTNAHAGAGKAFVIEADEYDNMFHGLRPDTAVVTSIEYDHPDFFPTPADMLASFVKFIGFLNDQGMLIGCVDDPVVRDLVQQRREAGLPAIGYGLVETSADWQIQDLQVRGIETHFTIVERGVALGSVVLAVPGNHNALNATAAIIAAMHQGVRFTDAVSALFSFRGTGRRFDLRADVGGVAIIDDYAHHPTAIRTNIHAARQRYPEREIWAVWQPHTFSRTAQLWTEFLSSFDEAHHVIVTDIYASREAFDPRVKSADFVQQLVHEDAYHAPQFEDAVQILLRQMSKPAVVLIMSAGDAPQIGKLLLERLQAES